MATRETSTGVKEHVLKMAALVDQSDDSELMPPTLDEIHVWTQNFVMVMGAMPDDIEEPTANQLVAFNKRVIKMLAAPYVDFAVWSHLRGGLQRLSVQGFHTVGQWSVFAT